MSGLIKSRDATARVRTFSSPHLRPAPEPQAVDPELAQLRADAEALAELVIARDAEIERLKEDVAQAREEGEAAGLKRGLAEADDASAASLAMLEKGVERALDRFRKDLGALERLSAALAREGLARLLGPEDARAELLPAVIRRQLAALERTSVVRVDVSAAEFTHPDALADLAASVGRAGLEIVASDELTAGDCRIKLTLGSIEVGVGQQWSRLAEVLDGLADGGGGE